MTFAEVLSQQEELGAARFSPDGGRLLVSLKRHGRPSRGAPWKLAATTSAVWDLETGRRTAIGTGGAAFYPDPCQPWSPSGRRLAGFVLQDGVRRLASWDRETGRTAVLAGTPVTMCVGWSGERMLYAVTAPGQPAEGSSGMIPAQHQLARWRDAWFTPAAQVTVHSSNPAFPNPPPKDGGLALADAATGHVQVIAAGAFHTITPSPDGRRVAVVRLGAADPAALNKATGRRGQAEIYDLTPDGAKLAQTLPGVDVDFAGLAWSPDGAQLLVGGRLSADDELALFVLRADGGPARRIALPRGMRLGEGQSASLSALRPLGWIGGRPAFIAATDEVLAAPADTRRAYGREPGFRLFAEGPTGVRSLTGFTHQSVLGFAAAPGGAGYVVADGALWQVGLGGAPRRLSDGDVTIVGLAPAWPAYGPPVRYAAADHRVGVTARDADGRLRTQVIDADTGRPVLAAARDETVALSPRLDAVLRQTDAGWSHRLSVSGRHARELTTLNAAWAGRAVGEVRPFDYAAGGRTLRGWIVLPPGYRGGALPALVWIYGGELLPLAPPPSARPGGGATPVFSGQLWAARGYAVIYPSTAIDAAADTDVPATLAAQAVAAVDAAAAQGWVDPARVGLIGHSFGAYSTAAVLSKRSDRFKAGVAMSGVYDFVLGWGARHPIEALVDEDGHGFREETVGYVERGQIGLRSPPWVDPDAYVQASPVFAAPQIRTPLLLTAGDLDLGSTSLAQSEQMYAALRRSGNPAVMVRYWGQPHVQDDPGAAADQWARFTTWFDHYLMAPPDLVRPSASAAPRPGRGPGSASGAPRIPGWPPAPSARRGRAR